jgi:hypothetical protein
MSKLRKPSIVFAHGLWADGSCFQKLIPALQADGHEVICSQHAPVPDLFTQKVDGVSPFQQLHR